MVSHFAFVMMSVVAPFAAFLGYNAKKKKLILTPNMSNVVCAILTVSKFHSKHAAFMSYQRFLLSEKFAHVT